MMRKDAFNIIDKNNCNRLAEPDPRVKGTNGLPIDLIGKLKARRWIFIKENFHKPAKFAVFANNMSNAESLLWMQSLHRI